MNNEIIKQIERYYKEFKTVNLEKLNKESQFLNVESYRCQLNNGCQIIRDKIIKLKGDGGASIVLAITIEKKFILTIEPRVFTKETVDIGIPAGYIERDEKPKDAAKRELLEETGYETNDLISLGNFYQDQGCSAACNHYFLARNCKKVKEQYLDDGEFIKYILVDYEELKWLIEKNYIRGLNSAYIIEKGMNYINQVMNYDI